MFLASCSYMLLPIIAVLRKNGIPFHNPYRKNNGFFNPLRTRSRHSAASRILALLVSHPDFGVGRRQWTIAHVRLFAEGFCLNGLLQPGARESLRTLARSADASLEDLFLPDALASLMVALEGTVGDLLSWYRDRLAPEFRNRIQFPFDIVRALGPAALGKEPKVVVGTIHSVKGGQADVVYLFPDLSKSGEGSTAGVVHHGIR